MAMKETEKRPVLVIPRSGFEKAMESFALFGVVLTLTLTAWYWNRLPDQIPKHFGASGQPDAWGDKGLLLILPAISVVFYLGLSILSRYPQKFNYLSTITAENAPVQYLQARVLVVCLKAILVWTFGWILWGTIQTALGNGAGLGVAFLPLILISIFAVISFYLVRSSRSHR